MAFIQSPPHSRGIEQVSRFPLLSNADSDNRISFNHLSLWACAGIQSSVPFLTAYAASTALLIVPEVSGLFRSFIHLYRLWRIGVQCGCTHGPTLHLMGAA